MIICNLFLLLFVIIAAGMDLSTSRIDNRWILFGITTGMLVRLLQSGMTGLLSAAAGMFCPILLLGWLFVFRMLGAGDIKLFCAIGAWMGSREITYGIFYAMLVGSGLSLMILLGNGILWERLLYFRNYVKEVWTTKKIMPYRKGGTERIENFHFSIPILCSVVLYLGGIY